MLVLQVDMRHFTCHLYPGSLLASTPHCMTRTHKRNKRLAAELRKTWSLNLNLNLESSTSNLAIDTGEALHPATTTPFGSLHSILLSSCSILRQQLDRRGPFNSPLVFHLDIQTIRAETRRHHPQC